MKKLMLLGIILMSFSSLVNAQKVFVVKKANEAQLKIFVVKYESEADLKVFYVKKPEQARWVMESKKTKLD